MGLKSIAAYRGCGLNVAQRAAQAACSPEYDASLLGKARIALDETIMQSLGQRSDPLEVRFENADVCNNRSSSALSLSDSSILFCLLIDNS